MFLPINGTIELPDTHDDEDEFKRSLRTFHIFDAMKRYHMIKIELIDKSDSDEPLNKDFDWDIVEYTEREMQIQVDFFEPINISQSKNDKLLVNFTRTNFLFDMYGVELVNGTHIYKDIPPIFPTKSEEKAFGVLESMFSSIETGSVAVDTGANALIARAW